MKGTIYTLMAIVVLVTAGCVSSGTHEETVAELDQARKATSKTAADLEAFKKQSAAQIAALEADKTKLSNELLAAQTETAKAQRDLDQARASLNTTLASRKEMEEDVRKIRSETSGMTRLNEELRRERDLLQAKSDGLEKNLNVAQQEFETKLKAEQATVAGLQNDKQLLMARATSATDELAKAQKRLGELEADASRVKDLEQRLSQREIELGRLAQGGETLAAEKQTLTAEKETLAADKERLEKERAAKEAEIQRLTKTQEDLTKSLQAQIDKGDIKIKQVRDRLTINMVEKVLFNSGQAQVKPEGLKMLKQVADVLKTVNDKQIRIEGHTDNVPISGKLKQKFPTNWELSTARATNVVRYFIEKGGVNRENFEAVGYADTKPVADNETDVGRTENRRIEIVLFPKDLSRIASDIKP